MPRVVKPIASDQVIRQLKPHPTKVIRLPDGRGLMVTVYPNGRKVWHLRYKLDGKTGDSTHTLGEFGEREGTLGLKAARDAADKARVQLNDGKDPGLEKAKAKREATAEQLADAVTFRAVAEEWLKKQVTAASANQKNARTEWCEDHAAAVGSAVERVLFAGIGDMPINTIRSKHLRDALLKHAAGAPSVQQRMCRLASRIFSYGVSTERCEYDIAAPVLKAGLDKHIPNSYASFKVSPVKGAPQTAYDFFAKLDELADDELGFPLQFWQKRLVLLTALLFVRRSEIRLMQWSQIDWDAALWVIPRDQMKQTQMHKLPEADVQLDHYVPLSAQALAILRELQARAKPGNDYVFCGHGKHNKPIGKNATLDLIERLGFKGDITGHGFRHFASTLLNNARPEDQTIVEEALAHAKPGVGGVYNLAAYLEHRRPLMQKWADMLDRVRKPAPVVAFPKAA